MSPEDLGRDKLQLWKENVFAFAEDNFDFKPDAWQAKVFEAFPHADHRRLAMKACKGPGKTAVMAILGWNFLVTRPQCKVAATSITKDNLRDNLWSEFAKWRYKSDFIKHAFTWTTSRIFANGYEDTWFASARSWPKTADKDKQAETLAGLHADYILFLIDECAGIPNAVVTTAEAALASGLECKLVMAGNPTDPTGPLGLACGRDKALWFVVTITGDPLDPDRSPRVSIDWAKEEIAKYGRENPWVMVNVLGQFPPHAINALLGMEEVESAISRIIKPEAYSWSQKRLGVDVARYGDDRTVIFPRQGLYAFLPKVIRNMDTISIAAMVARAKEDWGSEVEFIDDTGHWGHGVVDMLQTMGQTPIPLNYGAPALDPRYKNRRAEFWFKGADWVRAGGKLPQGLPELVGELITPTYTFNVEGKILLEEKEHVKARLGRSPDLADALFQTFAMADMPMGMTAQLAQQAAVRTEVHDGRPLPSSRTVQSDWDPFT